MSVKWCHGGAERAGRCGFISLHPTFQQVDPMNTSSPLPCGKPSRLKGKIDLSLGRAIGGGCVGSVSSLSGILLPSIASHTPPASG
ncbi:hypothetical protein E2C01_022992 [Portunus trituberculatus]|uniref:Uncharacterized protein n=1 Tax=Portunus trituberculatus TaxID=210409 RepID=A0A5B7EA00_PORTR|nr:hypothetical protein [Portunus trituberculatus]